jgi:hypothetical protein
MLISLLVLAATLAAPAAAGAQGEVVERAAQALRDAPVYQDPGAERALDKDELAALRREVQATGDRIFVAILPSSAGRPDDVTPQLARATRRDGTFAIVVGNSFRAVSNTEPQRTAAAEATAALDERGSDGAAAVLEDFVRRTAQPGLQAPAAEGGGNGGGDANGGGGGAPWLLILLLAGGGLLALRAAGRGRRRRAEQQAAFADVRGTAEADIAAIADDIRDLDDDVERAGAPPAAKEAYLRALDHYERADRTLRTAGTVPDLRGVAETAADGRYEMAVARAHLEQREPPERRAPCFFDPRHGPSVGDADFAPPGGQGRPVPVCAACATRLADGEEPEARSEVVGGRAMPYWAAPGAGYYGGAFGGFGPGLLGGLLIGSMFDEPAYGADHGDFGGEGFGGGDFGGGGFGGGDFGGGGFGGGDF